MQNARIGRQNIRMAASTITKKDKAIVAKIIGEFRNMSRQNIDDWRQALEMANDVENPRWGPLQDLYEYLRPDAHLGSQIDIRKGSVTATRFIIKDKSGKESKDKTLLLRKKWFKNLMKDLMDNISYGYTVIQVTDAALGKYDLIPRRNFVPQQDLILFESTGDKGVYTYDKAFADTILVVKNQYSTGILNDLVPNLIWKKNAQQAWAEFGEKFGNPMMTATTNKTDIKELDRLELMLRQLGEAAQAVLPMGTTVDVKDMATKGDPYNVWYRQMGYADEVISKRYLGGTMISDNGSSRSQSEVHERTLNFVLGEDDRTDIEFVVNDQLMPLLIAAGIGFQEGDEFEFDRSESLDLKDYWTIVSDAMSNHYSLDQEWVGDTFGFKILGPKAAPTADTAIDGDKPGGKPPIDKKPKPKAGFFA